ncbi:hypothetical protein [Streptomyces sp. NPDC005876]|jgi:hypothetical protein|uniref:hypothetical protein n=1 Tax=unclassified Streptomyces TaxID=2593676 RepID=UPI0033C16496
MTRTRTWAAAAAAAVGLLTAAAAPVAADQPARAAAPVPWSVSLGTAGAAGERWTEPSAYPGLPDLVISGTLTNTGTGCYAVWTRFYRDFSVGPVTKQAEICGPGSAAVAARQSYGFTTTGYVTVCRGTANTADCAPWANITWWPIDPSS